MWTRTDFRNRLAVPVVGMVHLRPLPGAPAWTGDLDAVEAAARRDAEALAAGGAGGVMVENYHDVPFFPDQVPAETIAAMTRLALAVRDASDGLPLGINVLRNDVRAALAVAASVGAAFVRVNVHVGAALTDQGVVEGRAAETMRLRRTLAPDTAVWADLRVKHAAPLAPRPLADEAGDLRQRGRADAVIVSGAATGAATDPARLAEARAALPDCPLLVGSGATATNAGEFRSADGFIVGTSLKTVADADGYGRIDPDRVAAFVAAVRARDIEELT